MFELREEFLMIHRAYKVLDKDIADKCVMHEKKYIRNTFKESEENPYKWRYRDYDSRWCKIEYEYEPMTETDIKDYIKSEWCDWYNPYNDGRDCTGVWFTHRINVFVLPKANKILVYHFQWCDVQEGNYYDYVGTDRQKIH